MAMEAGRSVVATAVLPAAPAEIFDWLDDPENLGAHMRRPSGMMAGGTMEYRFDAKKGRGTGARIGMEGRMLGLRLALDEEVVVHEPPRRKIWQTVGPQRLFIIGQYEMGFELAPTTGGTALRLFIRYTLPQGAWQVPARLLAPSYARWCVQRMLEAAVARFGTSAD